MSFSKCRLLYCSCPYITLFQPYDYSDFGSDMSLNDMHYYHSAMRRESLNFFECNGNYEEPVLDNSKSDVPEVKCAIAKLCHDSLRKCVDSKIEDNLDLYNNVNYWYISPELPLDPLIVGECPDEKLLVSAILFRYRPGQSMNIHNVRYCMRHTLIYTQKLIQYTVNIFTYKTIRLQRYFQIYAIVNIHCNYILFIFSFFSALFNLWVKTGSISTSNIEQPFNHNIFIPTIQTQLVTLSLLCRKMCLI